MLRRWRGGWGVGFLGGSGEFEVGELVVEAPSLIFPGLPAGWGLQGPYFPSGFPKAMGRYAALSGLKPQARSVA